jgi:very-short-patch-repair endonuclease
MTPAERRLWRALRGHRFADLHVRRQVPIGVFIVDFVCHAAKLVIEVDGGGHAHPANAIDDAVRDAWLRSHGYRVLRFWNADILTNLDGALQLIEDAVAPTIHLGTLSCPAA